MAKQKVKILVIIGEPLAGKGEVANFIIKKYGYKRLVYSETLSDILKIMNLPLVRPNFANLAIALREHFGGSILTQVLLEEARRRGVKKVIFDGARHPAEIDFLKKVPGFKCIYVTASVKTRYIRAKKRGEKSNEKTMSLADFKKEGRLATEAEFGKMSRGAIKIINESGVKELHKQIIEKLGKSL